MKARKLLSVSMAAAAVLLTMSATAMAEEEPVTIKVFSNNLQSLRGGQ